MTTTTDLATEDCPRTLALYRPGEPVPGVHHHFYYRGSMPCTGPKVCSLCGMRHPDHS